MSATRVKSAYEFYHAATLFPVTKADVLKVRAEAREAADSSLSLAMAWIKWLEAALDVAYNKAPEKLEFADERYYVTEPEPEEFDLI